MMRLRVTTESGNVYTVRLQSYANLPPVYVWEAVAQVRGRDPVALAIKAADGALGFALQVPFEGESLILTWTHPERGPQVRLSTPVVKIVPYSGDWCDVCDAPQWVLPDGTHNCGAVEPDGWDGSTDAPNMGTTGDF